MKTELQFLEYIERQIISAGEKIYTAWLKQEISFRKSEIENNPCQETKSEGEKMLSASVGKVKTSVKSEITQDETKPDTHSTKQELNKEILSDYSIAFEDICFCGHPRGEHKKDGCNLCQCWKFVKSEKGVKQ
jgi:hypothetical protein